MIISYLGSLCNQLALLRACNMFISTASAYILGLVLAGILVFITTYPTIRKYFIRYEYSVYLLTIAFFLFVNLILQLVSPTGGDIREHAHAGFLVSRGLVPYTDFFEHHNPLYWYLIAPVFLLSTSVSALYILYLFSFLTLVLSCLYLFKIGLTLSANKRVSYLMVIYFLSMKNVLESYQIRPDSLSTLFLLISFFYLIDAEDIRGYVKSGILGGISLLFLQKSMLYVMGFALLILLDASWRKGFAFRIKASACFFIGSMLPLGLYLLYIGMARGAQGLLSYYYLNYTFNLELIVGYNVGRRLMVWGITNWGHVLLAILGFYIILRDRNEYRRSHLMLGAQIVNVAVLLHFVDRGIIGPQYFQYAAPFFSFGGAIAFVSLAKKVPYVRERFYYGACVVVLVVVPLSLAVLNVATAKPDNHEIMFYMENFRGAKTNCNFIFHGNYQYKWFDTGLNSDELLAKYRIANERRNLEDLIEEGYPVICIRVGDVDSEEGLLKNGYAEYKGKGGKTARIFYRIDRKLVDD